MTTSDDVERAGLPSHAAIPAATIHVPGSARSRNRTLSARIRMMVVLVPAGFLLIAGRLALLGTGTTDDAIEGVARDIIQASRPPILDRNGIVLAVDIRVLSLFAEPRRIVDVDEALEKLRTVLPDLDEAWLRDRLTGDEGFVWIKREVSPAVEDQVMRLDLPGVDFLQESKRFYPPGSEIAHVVGSVNVDNQGIAGMELAIDRSELAVLQEVGLARGATLEPKVLSIDMRVQHAMREELLAAIERFGGGGLFIVSSNSPDGRPPSSGFPSHGRRGEISRI